MTLSAGIDIENREGYTYTDELIITVYCLSSLFVSSAIRIFPKFSCHTGYKEWDHEWDPPIPYRTVSIAKVLIF